MSVDPDLESYIEYYVAKLSGATRDEAFFAAGSKLALSRLEAARQEFLKSPNYRDRMEWIDEPIGELKEGPIS